MGLEGWKRGSVEDFSPRLPQLGYTISIYLPCISGVNQVVPRRDKGISIALGSISHGIGYRSRYSLV